MKNLKELVFVLVVITIAAGCSKTHDEPDCVPIVHNLEPGEEYNIGSLSLYDVKDGKFEKIKDYEVSDDLLRFQQDEAKHAAMWDYITRLIPEENLTKITEFLVFHKEVPNGVSGEAGYVETTDEAGLSMWRMAIGMHIAEDTETIDLSSVFGETVLHEYGHILTLNDDELDGEIDHCDCDNYVGHGCPYDDAIIGKIYNLGWSDIESEHTLTSITEKYEKYQDRFLSIYGATSIAEDAADVFTHFIRYERPTGNTIADQKVLLFYEYPEYVALRDAIRNN